MSKSLDVKVPVKLMGKHVHEIRDPIHVFIRFDDDERRVIDSRPFQRLRHIHQLAMTYLVYPGASHKRFEHSLGVMELAGKVYDVVMNRGLPKNLEEYVKGKGQDFTYWRSVLRMAALCHDLGHLPFSHAAETHLLPYGWSHERMTREIILSDEMRQLWEDMQPALEAEAIVKLAIGPRKARDLTFNDWESLLTEIITGDAFGVDRMDYLLRDSYHTGVGYGSFDHHRLIDTLCILKSAPTDDGEQSDQPVLGVEEGGLHAAEALPLARYFMFSQVYCHPVRRIYDMHLKDFLAEWQAGAKFPTDVEKYLRITDNEVMSAMLSSATDPARPGHKHASRIMRRKHFKILYTTTPDDTHKNPNAAEVIFDAAGSEFGDENVRFDQFPSKDKDPAPDFPVLAQDGRTYSAGWQSQLISRIPMVVTDYVFIEPELREMARKWLNANRDRILADSTVTEETA